MILSRIPAIVKLLKERYGMMFAENPISDSFDHLPVTFRGSIVIQPLIGVEFSAKLGEAHTTTNFMM
jgi:hypothetical protein